MFCSFFITACRLSGMPPLTPATKIPAAAEDFPAPGGNAQAAGMPGSLLQILDRQGHRRLLLLPMPADVSDHGETSCRFLAILDKAADHPRQDAEASIFPSRWPPRCMSNQSGNGL